MRLTILLTALLLAMPFLAAPAIAEPPDAAVYDRAPYNQVATYMGSISCVDTFPCVQGAANGSAMIQMANACVMKLMGAKEPTIGRFTTSGKYANCALPRSHIRHDNGFDEWQICCIAPVEANSTSCRLQCHRYFARQTDSANKSGAGR